MALPMQQLLFFGLVFLGGGVGSICRYGLAVLAQPWAMRFPWATLVANALACLVLGLVLGWHQQALLSDQRRLLLATGFCGGFSTFSTFTAESLRLFQQGQSTLAYVNVVLSLTLSLGCLLLGLKMSA